MRRLVRIGGLAVPVLLALLALHRWRDYRAVMERRRQAGAFDAAAMELRTAGRSVSSVLTRLGIPSAISVSASKSGHSEVVVKYRREFRAWWWSAPYVIVLVVRLDVAAFNVDGVWVEQNY